MLYFDFILPARFHHSYVTESPFLCVEKHLSWEISRLYYALNTPFLRDFRHSWAIKTPFLRHLHRSLLIKRRSWWINTFPCRFDYPV